MRHHLLGAIVLAGSIGLAHAQTSVASPDAAPGSGREAIARPDDASPDAVQPAKGANSFSRNQARRRISAKGYVHVTGLAKDADGVWRGQATRNGQPVQVWLDYTGKVGRQS